MARPKRLTPANDNRPREVMICGLSAELPLSVAEIEIIEVFLPGLAERIVTGKAPAAANENVPQAGGEGEDRE